MDLQGLLSVPRATESATPLDASRTEFPLRLASPVTALPLALRISMKTAVGTMTGRFALLREFGSP